MPAVSGAAVSMLPEDIGLLSQVEDPQLAPDGGMVAFVVVEPDVEANRYRRRIWMSSTGSDAATPRPFTGPGSERSPRWSADGRLLAFVSSDENGTAEICILPVAGGGERVVAAGWPASVTDLAWSPDGRWLAFLARDSDVDHYGAPGAAKPAKDMPPRRVTNLSYRYNGVGWTADRPARVFVVPADGSRPPRSLTPGPFDADGLAWSPDSRRIAFASGRHPTHDLDGGVDLWVVDIDGRSEILRLIGDGRAYSSPSWSPDGTSLAYLVHPTPLENPRHRQVGVLRVDTKAQQTLTGDLDRNCGPFGVGRGVVWAGDRLVFGVEDRGNVHLYQVAANGSGAPGLLLGGERWISEWDWAGGTLAFVDSSAVALPELMVAGSALDDEGELSRPGPGHRLTDLTRALTERTELAPPQRFIAQSKDGSEVECWAIPPVGAVLGQRYPTLLNVHGGPFTQYGNRLTDDFQLQAAAGFGVLYCNPRGSSGYSEAWGRAIRWPGTEAESGTGWGSVDFEDVMACVDEAARHFDWVDEDRLGILGGSYGGYMTSWAIGHTDRFKAACSERACNNLATMEHSMDISGFIRSYVGRDHLEDEDAYRRHSPVTYIKDMTTPMLIVHSEDDLRCPIPQAEELFVGLRRLGRKAEMVRFPGENHELTRSGSPAHRIMRARLILDWFQEHLH